MSYLGLLCVFKEDHHFTQVLDIPAIQVNLFPNQIKIKNSFKYFQLILCMISLFQLYCLFCISDKSAMGLQYLPELS